MLLDGWTQKDIALALGLEDYQLKVSDSQNPQICDRSKRCLQVSKGDTLTLHNQTDDCERFEVLLDKVNMTPREIEFYHSHRESCPLGIHTKEGLARRSLRENNPAYFDRLLNALKAPLTHSKQTLMRLVGMSSERFTPHFSFGHRHWLTGIVYAKYNELRLRTRLQPDRQEALIALLRPTGDIAYSAAKSHLGFQYASHKAKWQQSGFPHDSAAIAAFRRLDRHIAFQVPGDSRQTEVPPHVNLVASGSPLSSDDARLYLPYWQSDSPGVNFSNTFQPESIPYHFFVSHEKTITVRSGAMGGQLVKNEENGIVVAKTGKLWKPRHYTDSSGHLKTDFLLITKLPRAGLGGDVVLMSGGHGAGSEAFTLLFDSKAFPKSELNNLMTAIGSAPYFQIVLECSAIRDDRDMTRAYKLSICEDCPPTVIDAHALEAKDKEKLAVSEIDTSTQRGLEKKR